MKKNENKWRKMKMDKNRWKQMKTDENEWKKMEKGEKRDLLGQMRGGGAAASSWVRMANVFL